MSARITGRFEAGISVRLTKAGEADILATSVAPLGELAACQVISADFDTKKARGLWNLALTFPDGTETILANAFTIEQGTAPQFRREQGRY